MGLDTWEGYSLNESLLAQGSTSRLNEPKSHITHT
jgi:hypothetical protein